MKWRKLGLVYAPAGDQWWARTHAFIPTAHRLDERTVRVYFTGLDDHQVGRVGFVDVDARQPTRVVRHSAEPCFDIGALGAFDDSGVNASCVVDLDEETRRLYYIGWQRTQGVPYMLFTGLAQQGAGEASFTRVSRVPVLDRTDAEPFSRSAPCVLREGAGYRAWYWTCDQWTREGEWVHYNNVIASAYSSDGVQWTTGEGPCLAPEGADYSLGRPWVLRDADRFRMWFSIRSRSEPYRMGYAESTDGRTWLRLDELAGVERSSSGWDSEMVCFPCVVDAGGQRFMFYNGNRHGATGFGVAVCESD